MSSINTKYLVFENNTSSMNMKKSMFLLMVMKCHGPIIKPMSLIIQVLILELEVTVQ